MDICDLAAAGLMHFFPAMSESQAMLLLLAGLAPIAIILYIIDKATD
jgi:hypothetical protein